MGSMSYFGQAVQEILQNNYLKTNFENSKFRDFVSIFGNFREFFFLKKCSVFWILNAHISGTIIARELNEAFLKTFVLNMKLKKWLDIPTLVAS